MSTQSFLPRNCAAKIKLSVLSVVKRGIMIISRTPFRISFFGGGTDYPIWYNHHKGAVLSTSINKYCYITCRYLPPFFNHRYRIIYSKMEEVKDFKKIRHPAAREVIRFMKIKDGLEIHHDGDLPARTGLGSSSSFTVGLLNALYALKGTMVSKRQLALESIYIEQEMIKENVGSQDQVVAAHGGLNRIDLGGDDKIKVQNIILNKKRLQDFQDHLMLYFTGFSRTASEIAKKQIEITPGKKKELSTLYQMVGESVKILCGKRDLKEFGKLLHEGWLIKKSLTNKISNSTIDDIYSAARSSGALGGKLLGAGGGGFMLLFAKPQDQPKIKAKLKKLLYVPFKFEDTGSQIIVYQPD